MTRKLLDETGQAKLEAFRRWAGQSNDGHLDFSVVIPTYNEEWRILPTIGAIAAHMSSLGIRWELIIADDGSTDTTVELVENLNLPGLRLLKADRNRGKGDAVRRGMLAARGRLVLFADADQSTPIEQLEKLTEEVDRGFDVVVASRSAAGAVVANKSLLRDVMSKGLQIVMRVGLRLNVTDTQCGFKLFTKKAAHDIFARQTIDGFSFDLELLYLAGKLGYRVTEVPIRWFDAPGSKVDAFKVAARFLRDIAAIRVNDIQGRYTLAESAAAIESPVLRS